VYGIDHNREYGYGEESYEELSGASGTAMLKAEKG